MNGGGANNAEAGTLGDVHVEALIAQPDSVAAGTHADWTPSSGVDHGAMVDDAVPDDNATYNESSTPGNLDSYEYPSLAVIADVRAVQSVMSVAKSLDVGSRNIRVFTRPGATDRFGAVQPVAGSSYLYYRKNEDLNPDTSLPYTVAEVNGMEAGVELNA
jgi:hypothetical protein